MSCDHLWPLVLAWFNFDQNMPSKVWWNCLSIPKPQQWNRWSLRLDKEFYSHFILDVITCPCWDWIETMLVKGASGLIRSTLGSRHNHHNLQTMIFKFVFINKICGVFIRISLQFDFQIPNCSYGRIGSGNGPNPSPVKLLPDIMTHSLTHKSVIRHYMG